MRYYTNIAEAGADDVMTYADLDLESFTYNVLVLDRDAANVGCIKYDDRPIYLYFTCAFSFPPMPWESDSRRATNFFRGRDPASSWRLGAVRRSEFEC